MLGTKKKFKKKTGKKAFPIEVKKESVPNDVRHASPPPIPGEKLLAVLQDWKSQSQNAIMLNAANSMEIKTAQQDSKELKLIFKCVDTNNTGFLHEGEVQSALELLGFVINNTGQERIKKWTDSNEGRLSFRVFKELVAEWHGETRDFYNELKKGFSMIDHGTKSNWTIDTEAAG
ncbi:uncharacterized protein LOC142501292 isoform X2 [Ascaphus truei]|uniref:uncharacterized protein LOC142501292 isoform X2 n=1 Tax=Ascaphus truei TaxID=8439 RepID=UPI003F5A6148